MKKSFIAFFEGMIILNLIVASSFADECSSLPFPRNCACELDKCGPATYQATKSPSPTNCSLCMEACSQAMALCSGNLCDIALTGAYGFADCINACTNLK